MLRFVIPLVLAAVASAKIVHERIPRIKYSAASDAQIVFALENKYDDTGPGAKKPEYAYKTFKTLDEALLDFIDDPDTKLPELERSKVLLDLVKPDEYDNDFYSNQEFVPKTLADYSQTKPKHQLLPLVMTKNSFPEKKLVYHNPSTRLGNLDNSGLGGFEGNPGTIRNLQVEKLKTPEPYKLLKIQQRKGNTLNLGHYKKSANENMDQFDPNPRYSYSYGVHDQETGDLKTAHEVRDGGTVHGFYSFIDSDGTQRTVRYSADDKRGFRATVQKN